MARFRCVLGYAQGHTTGDALIYFIEKSRYIRTFRNRSERETAEKQYIKYRKPKPRKQGINPVHGTRENKPEIHRFTAKMLMVLNVLRTINFSGARG